MLLDPETLRGNSVRVEDIEKASLRFVTQAIYQYRNDAAEIFQAEDDLVADIGEDITREALDRLGTSSSNQRLWGKIAYKRARYLFHSDYAIKQALFVDSKAEKMSGQLTATLQTSQFSLSVRQMRFHHNIEIRGKLPVILEVKGEKFITTTIFVKYNYADIGARHELKSITIAALPNGMLQDKYNKDCRDTIWLAGRNAPSRGEEFRVRVSFPKL